MNDLVIYISIMLLFIAIIILFILYFFIKNKVGPAGPAGPAGQFTANIFYDICKMSFLCKNLDSFKKNPNSPIIDILYSKGIYSTLVLKSEPPSYQIISREGGLTITFLKDCDYLYNFMINIPPSISIGPPNSSGVYSSIDNWSTPLIPIGAVYILINDKTIINIDVRQSGLQTNNIIKIKKNDYMTICINSQQIVIPKYGEFGISFTLTGPPPSI